MPATTPNSPSKRKQIDKMNKPELMEEVRYHRQKEEEYENLIKELKHDVKGIKDELNEIKCGRGSTSARDDFETRLIQIERRLAEQEQYTRLECVDFPENLKGEKLEAVVLNVFEVAGVPIEKRDSMQYTDYVTPGWLLPRFVIAEMRLQSFAIIRRNFVN